MAEIDWAKPVAEIYNLIRAANPAPGAWGTIKGQKVDIFDSAKSAGTGKPGESSPSTTRASRSRPAAAPILVKRVRARRARRLRRADLAKSAGLKAGDRFENPLRRKPDA